MGVGPAGNSARVLIVGAGPTGLTAAIELARRGIAVRIIDRDKGPTPLSKAVGISPRSLDILEPAGVTHVLLERGLRLTRACFRHDGHELGAIDVSRLRHRFNFLLSLPQSETEDIMAEALAGLGVEVEWDTCFEDLEESTDNVSATLRKHDLRTKPRFDIVFGADGADSAVRGALGLPFEGYTHHRLWSIADVEIEKWPYEPMALEGFLHDGGDFGLMVPVGGNRFRAFSNTPDALSQVPASVEVGRVLRADTFHIPVRQVPTYQTARVFLGGDAAHVHSPMGARGMNLGIEDAAAFARRLADGKLAGYTDERHPVGKRWIRLSETMLRMVQARGPVTTFLRNAALTVVGHAPILQRPALERLAGLKE